MPYLSVSNEGNTVGLTTRTGMWSSTINTEMRISSKSSRVAHLACHHTHSHAHARTHT